MFCFCVKSVYLNIWLVCFYQHIPKINSSNYFYLYTSLGNTACIVLALSLNFVTQVDRICTTINEVYKYYAFYITIVEIVQQQKTASWSKY